MSPRLDEAAGADIGQLRGGRLIEIIGFHQSDASASVFPAHDRGVSAGIERGHDGRFEVVGGRDGAGDDFGFLRVLPVIIGNDRAVGFVQFEDRIGQGTGHWRIAVRQGGPDGAQDDFLRFRAGDDEAANEDIIAGLDVEAGRDVEELARRGLGVKIGHFRRAQLTVENGHFIEPSTEETSGEDAAFSHRKGSAVHAMSAGHIGIDEVAIEVKTARCVCGEGPHDHVPLIQIRVRKGDRVGDAGAGFGEKFEQVIGVDLQVEVISELRLTRDIEGVTRRGRQGREIKPGDDRTLLVDLAAQAGCDKAGCSVELHGGVGRVSKDSGSRIGGADVCAARESAGVTIDLTVGLRGRGEPPVAEQIGSVLDRTDVVRCRIVGPGYENVQKCGDG